MLSALTTIEYFILKKKSNELVDLTLAEICSHSSVIRQRVTEQVICRVQLII